MNLMKHGRKWLALQITVVTIYIVLGMSFILAFKQRLTGDWSSLMSVLLLSLSGATAAFMGTNAAITKMGIEHGQPQGEG
ncbi:MAG: hypothetical protein L0191_09990 [Acidobacteria bacterium]|nr:hypothetical protein [Acidobacteriota bacterium]